MVACVAFAFFAAVHFVSLPSLRLRLGPLQMADECKPRWKYGVGVYVMSALYALPRVNHILMYDPSVRLQTVVMLSKAFGSGHDGDIM